MRPVRLPLGLFLVFTAATWPDAVAARPVVQDRGLSDLLGELPSIGELLDTGITVLTQLLTTLKSGQLQQNGLRQLMHLNVTANGTTSAVAAGNTTCPDMAVIFARGTSEPGKQGGTF
jgi:hypothetical protein